jgi:3-oxoacyl-[acyl-carrier protein] reductase
VSPKNTFFATAGGQSTGSEKQERPVQEKSARERATDLPHFARDGSGRIINIGGSAGMMEWEKAMTHGINNSAIMHASTYLARDLAPDKITVNTVVPGLVDTEWREVWAGTRAEQQGKSRETFLADYCQQLGILAGRWASMDEVADAVVFLASDRAKYINGTRLVIDGGLSVNPR